MSSKLTVGGGGDGNIPGLRAHYQDHWEYSGGVSEIEEEYSDEVYDTENRVIKPPLSSIKEEAETSSVFSLDFNGEGGNVVYVAVGKPSDSNLSMDALIWALNNLVIFGSSVVFLIHVFPETKFIPTPLGMLPISQTNPVQKENHMAQERAKRRDHLQKFLNVCSTNQVKVDTILIESDLEAKAILDLIPILNIRKLVLGTTKSNAKRLMRSRKGNGVTDQILQNAPEFCQVKIICEGKEMSELTMDSLSPSSSTSPSSRSIDGNTKLSEEPKQTSQKSSACGCFKL